VDASIRKLIEAGHLMVEFVPTGTRFGKLVSHSEDAAGSLIIYAHPKQCRGSTWESDVAVRGGEFRNELRLGPVTAVNEPLANLIELAEELLIQRVGRIHMLVEQLTSAGYG